MRNVHRGDREAVFTKKLVPVGDLKAEEVRILEDGKERKVLGVELDRRPLEVAIEAHRGMLTDNYGEVTERASQTLAGQPAQFKAWTFGAGQHDYFREQISCGLP